MKLYQFMLNLRLVKTLNVKPNKKIRVMSFYFNLKSFRLGILYGIVTAFIFTLCACGEEENSPVPEKPEEEEEVFLNLPEASMSHTFSSDGGVFSVDFTSSHAWTAEVASEAVSWLHVSPEQGEGGASTIQITADENTGDTPRTGTVTIRSGELSRTISVTQQERVIVPGSDGPDDMPIEPW